MCYLYLICLLYPLYPYLIYLSYSYLIHLVIHVIDFPVLVVKSSGRINANPVQNQRSVSEWKWQMDTATPPPPTRWIIAMMITPMADNGRSQQRKFIHRKSFARILFVFCWQLKSIALTHLRVQVITVVTVLYSERAILYFVCLLYCVFSCVCCPVCFLLCVSDVCLFVEPTLTFVCYMLPVRLCVCVHIRVYGSVREYAFQCALLDWCTCTHM